MDKMNMLPSINTFLQEIDPEKTINREKATSEITMITLLWAIKEAKDQLSQADQDKINEILQNQKEFNFEKIYELFDNAGKKEELLNLINRNVNKVRIDYIKSHLKALTEEKRKAILDKFPALKELTV